MEILKEQLLYMKKQLLFIEPLEFKSSCPLENCVERLRYLDEPPDRISRIIMGGLRVFVNRDKENRFYIDVEIRHGNHVGTHFAGVLFISSDDNKTTLSGAIDLGSNDGIEVLVYLFIIMMGLLFTKSLQFCVLGLCLIIYTLIGALGQWSDRGRMKEILGKVMQAA